MASQEDESVERLSFSSSRRIAVYRILSGAIGIHFQCLFADGNGH
jgi:hypothetical protein